MATTLKRTRGSHTTAVSLVLAAVLSVLCTGVYARGGIERSSAKRAIAIKKNRKVSRKMNLSASRVLAGKLSGRSLSHVSARSHKGAFHTVTKPEKLSPADLTSAPITFAFQQQKGHLPWPVEPKKIATRFGLQEYMPNVQHDNLGINIQVDQDSIVRVVYDGIVDDVIDIGDAKAVMVLHGKYFTIYSDLSKANVVRGQQLTAGEVIGKVGVSGELDFRIFDPHDVWMDPQKWLIRANASKNK